jgi:hypothetical protein
LKRKEKDISGSRIVVKMPELSNPKTGDITPALRA